MIKENGFRVKEIGGLKPTLPKEKLDSCLRRNDNYPIDSSAALGMTEVFSIDD